MIRKIVLVLGAFLVLTSGVANADEYWEACNACSLNQKKMVAKQAVPLTHKARHQVYVMDFATATLMKFSVFVFYDGEVNRYVAPFPISQAVDPSVSGEFAAQVSAIKSAMATLRSGTKIPETVIPSAYDVILSANAQRKLSAYVNDNLSIWQSIGLPVSVPLAALGKLVDVNFVIPVKFADGSTLKVKLSGVSGSIGNIEYLLTYVPGSARDADGNLIPDRAERAAPYVGEFGSEDAAMTMSHWITEWFGQIGTGGVSCRMIQGGGSDVTVHCVRK